MLKWISNTQNPKKWDSHFFRSKEDEQSKKMWLADKIIGEPQATQWHSVEELKAWDLVGVYIEVPDEVEGAKA